ncbi:protein trichome birefringence-like 19 [Sesamum alatum]|uniref:Protein trichome birefringence-like 19 n=1 Tax=Sesamum alatum TaxID=300844 RepID=A0AAE1Y9R8_9LAMI|nr:protein trichome birefringence-like 19 [Sesamum alatum]
MKFQASEQLPVGKPQARRKTSKLAPLVALTVFLTIPLYYPTIRETTRKLSEPSRPYETLEDDAIKPTTLLETTPTDNTDDEPSTLADARLETSPTDNTDESSTLTDARLETPPTENTDESSTLTDVRLETPPADNTDESSTLTDARLETGDGLETTTTDNTEESLTLTGARLETLPGEETKQPSTLTGSHLEALPQENTNDGNSGGETAVNHQGAPGKKKDGKERKKRSDRPRTESAGQDGRRQLPIGRSKDQIESSKDSSRQETRTKAIIGSNDPPQENRKNSSPGINIRQPISRNNAREMVRSRLLDEDQCDMFTGEWVPNPNGPYYTNETCSAIQQHQNCIKFGRPDREFLKWRWKPDDCELPLFDPNQFLELVRGKSIAFVGDSVARNHMQSLICLLSRVAIPVDLAAPLDQNRRYEYREHDFNVSIFWAPYLVRTEKTDPDDEKRPFKLYLDEFDEHWTTQIGLFDYVIISAGHWFFRPTYFYLNNRLSGCLYCPESDVSHLTAYFSYRRAFRTAFRAINAANYNGVTFLRTYAPSHFEGAPWDKGGDCARKRPYRRNETVLEDYGLEMYLIQLEELRIAQKAGRRRGGKFRLFDATKSMLLRPDGHPSKYGHWPVANQTIPNDCVHWCLPGPIDAWNDFLQELLKREIR